MSEERRCDLCQDEDMRPCPNGGCNSANNLKDFKQKGSEKKDTGCAFCKHWSAISIGTFCPDCGQLLENVNF